MHCLSPVSTHGPPPACVCRGGVPCWWRRCAPLLLLAALSGCASKGKPPVYAGRIAEGTPVVTIYPSGTGALGVPVYVSAVDGVRVKFKWNVMHTGWRAPVRVAAGFHEVQVTIPSQVGETRVTFGHDFQAGHTYKVGLAHPIFGPVRLHDLTAGTSRDIQEPTRL